MMKKGNIMCYNCKDIAFILTIDVRNGEPMMSDVILHKDGTPMEAGSIVKCDSCGGRIDVYKLWHHNVGGD